jgi:hypothetical protein
MREEDEMRCGDECPHFYRCDIEGHERVGWCDFYRMFSEEDDECEQ